MSTTHTPTTISALVGIDTKGITWGELRAIAAATAHQDDDQIYWHFDRYGNLDGIYVALEA